MPCGSAWPTAMPWSSEKRRIARSSSSQRTDVEVGHHLDAMVPSSGVARRREHGRGERVEVETNWVVGRPGGDPAGHHEEVPVEGDLDTHECLGVVPACGLDDRFGEGVAEPVGMTGQDVLGGDDSDAAHRASSGSRVMRAIPARSSSQPSAGNTASTRTSRRCNSATSALVGRPT